MPLRITNFGRSGELTAEQLSKAVQWLEKADFEAKIVVAGIVSLASDASAISGSRKAREP